MSLNIIESRNLLAYQPEAYTDLSAFETTIKNAEHLRLMHEDKKEIERVARELGYSSVSDAVDDLRSLGLLDRVISGEIEDCQIPQNTEVSSTLTKRKIADIAAQCNLKSKLDKQGFLIKSLTDELFTCKEFSFLMKHTGYDVNEKDLFIRLANNIVDLENFKLINWTYSSQRSDLISTYSFIYPEIKSGKKADRIKSQKELGSRDQKDQNQVITKWVLSKFKEMPWFVIIIACIFGVFLGSLL